jgi:Asp-tRNA(Asn)/Glu-tRNA(Gln) amidotransferase A subunit family amidase
VTRKARASRPTTRRRCDQDGLRGKRIGVARNFFGSSTEVDAVIEKELAVLKAQGAILVDVKVPNVDKYGDSEPKCCCTNSSRTWRPTWPATRRMRRSRTWPT